MSTVFSNIIFTLNIREYSTHKANVSAGGFVLQDVYVHNGRKYRGKQQHCDKEIVLM